MNVKRQSFLYISILIIIVAVAIIFFYVRVKNAPSNLKKETETGKVEPDLCQPNEDILTEQVVDANSASETSQNQTALEYPIHKNISVTFFWIGEDASEDNKEISNNSSAWDDFWVKHYGGTDNPEKRNGYMPAKFAPMENPFYFALPYNDFDKKGERKKDVASVIPWAKDMKLGESVSYCKNRWIKIIKDDKVAYGQWEDVGPFGEDDVSYVFGSAEPKSKTNKHAGLDVSPAVRDFLGISGKDMIDWQFIEAGDVPDGPWKKIVTKTNICWK
jgi:hypothetical protein